MLFMGFVPGWRVSLSRMVLAALWMSLLAKAWAVPSADGLYATFTIKRGNSTLGEFTCRLDYQLAPKTVANFVGLATGQRGWVDFQKGGVSHKPFYNGITFHRVVAGFVIQAGSPNGLGTDGPGYTFKDEFHASLRHSQAGILSMANSGPQSNGSQFFITLAATSHLDDVHSVFGQVVENLSVMQSVQQGDIISQVTITRNGAAAQAFDIHTQGLPTVTDATPALARNGSNFQLNYPQSDDAEYFVHHSDNLTAWQAMPGKELYISPPAQTGRDVTALTTGAAQKFFTVTKAQYAEALHTLATVAGKRVTMGDASGNVFAWSFSTASTGTYTLNSSSAFPIQSYSWTQEAYRGRLIGSITGLALGSDPITQMNINLMFTSATGGTYKGALITLGNQQFPLAGNFVLSNL
jgi:cyclophilin family peptidyl-prolyl cis-trans isomerase